MTSAPLEQQTEGKHNLAMVKEAESPPKQALSASSLYSLKYLAYGACAATISRTATAPLERIRVLQVIDPMLKGASAAQPIWLVVRRVIAEDGLLGLWRGNLANLIRMAPTEAVRQFVFDSSKKVCRVDQCETPHKNELS